MRDRELRNRGIELGKAPSRLFSMRTTNGCQDIWREVSRFWSSRGRRSPPSRRPTFSIRENLDGAELAQPSTVRRRLSCRCKHAAIVRGPSLGVSGTANYDCTDGCPRAGGAFMHKGDVFTAKIPICGLKVLLNESVQVHLEPLVQVHTEASDLKCAAIGRRGRLSRC